MSTLLSVSVAILAGLLMTRALKPLKLPDVTAYLLAGVLVGPYCLGALGIEGLGFTSASAVSALSLISEVALGFIAFSIGNEFRLSELKHTGRQAVVIGIVQALVATLFVDLALLGLHLIIPDKLTAAQAITLGAIATATAPAATLMVVRQYKAKGPLTSLLLPVVALDDAVGLAVFAVSFGIAQAMGSGSVDVISVAVEPILEIVLSLALGALLGELLSRLEKIFHSNQNRMALIVGFVLLTVALSQLSFDIGAVHLGFSTLLVCMSLGTIFCNRCPLSTELMEKSEKWTSPLFALFFVLCGAELELSVFSQWSVVLIGVIYILFRCVGKYFGALWSCKLAHCQPQVTKWLGITLFPQAGVALGMCTIVAPWGAQGQLIRNIILFSVLVYELFGPVMTKYALTKAGDIHPATRSNADIRAERILEHEHKRKHG